MIGGRCPAKRETEFQAKRRFPNKVWKPRG
jgi:hypothetical protein